MMVLANGKGRWINPDGPGDNLVEVVVLQVEDTAGRHWKGVNRDPGIICGYGEMWKSRSGLVRLILGGRW